MPTPIRTPIPAGWYPDPDNSAQQRWWSGESWTNEVARFRARTLHETPQTDSAARGAESATPTAEQRAAGEASQRSYSARQAAATLHITGSRQSAVNPHIAPQRAQAPQSRHAAGSAPMVMASAVRRETSPGSSKAAASSPSFSVPVGSMGVGSMGLGSVATRSSATTSSPAVRSSAAQTSAALSLVRDRGVATRMQGAPLAQTAPRQRHVLPTSTREAEPTALSAPQPGHASRSVRTRLHKVTAPSVYRPQRRYTTAAWALTILPGIAVATMVAVQSVAPRAESLWAGTIILLLALHVLIASSDRAALVSDGHVKAASPMLAVLGPVYFIVRAVIVSRQTKTNAVWPLLVNLIVVAAVIASLLSGDDAVIRLVGMLR